MKTTTPPHIAEIEKVTTPNVLLNKSKTKSSQIQKQYTPTQVKQHLQLFANHLHQNPTSHFQKSNKRKFDAISSTINNNHGTDPIKENSTKKPKTSCVPSPCYPNQ